MTRMTMVVVALSGSLTACTLIGKGKATLGGDSSHTSSNSSSKVGSKPVVADEDDPPHVRSVLDKLTELEALIRARDFGTYALEHRRLLTVYLFQNGWQGENKHDAIGARLEALDAMAYPAFGGRLAPLVGDARRVQEADEDAVAAASAAIKACKEAASLQTTGRGDAIAALETATKAYVTALDRTKKADATAFRYIGSLNGSMIDVPSNLLECEVKLAESRAQFEDEYKPEVASKVETERGCGVVEFAARGVQVRGGSFAPYERSPGGASLVERIACTKIPKHSKLPAPLKHAAAAYAEHAQLKLKDVVFVVKGAPTVEEDDDDLRLYRYQLLDAYSRKFEFAKNPCGDGKTFCEAGGSKSATLFNRMEHALDRAAVHAGKRPDRCKKHLEEAKKQADWFAQFHADAVKSKDWVGGATYKTKKGVKLAEKELLAAFETNGKLADDRLLAKYCTKAAQGPK
jgi:hypothetical protein